MAIGFFLHIARAVLESSDMFTVHSVHCVHCLACSVKHLYLVLVDHLLRVFSVGFVDGTSHQTFTCLNNSLKWRGKKHSKVQCRLVQCTTVSTVWLLSICWAACVSVCRSHPPLLSPASFILHKWKRIDSRWQRSWSCQCSKNSCTHQLVLSLRTATKMLLLLFTNMLF